VTATGHLDRAVTDPVGLIVDLVNTIDHHLAPDHLHAVVTGVAGGRAKARSLATALAKRPAVLGRRPLSRPQGDRRPSHRPAQGRGGGGLTAAMRNLP
jgi:hypothetical protein